MPDQFGDLTGAPSAALGAASPPKPSDELAAKTRATNRQIAAVSAQAKKDIDAALSRVQQRDAAAGSLQPPRLEALPAAPVPKTTSPAEEWGSLAMLAAGIGSLLTRSHATAALNAAADVMTGYHKHDQEAAAAAFQRWKIASANLSKIQDFQLKEYEAALAGVNRSDATDLRGAELSNLAGASQVHALAIANGDYFMEHRAKAGDIAAMDKHLLTSQKLKAATDTAAEKATQFGEYALAEKALEATPKYQALLKTNPLRAYAELYDLRRGKAPALDTRGDGTQPDQRAALAIYNAQYKNPATGETYDHIDPATGRPAIDPKTGLAIPPPQFEAWYKTAWPTWGAKNLGPEPVARAAPARIQTDAQYEALPSGSVFMGPDGVLRKKP